MRRSAKFAESSWRPSRPRHEAIWESRFLRLPTCKSENEPTRLRRLCSVPGSCSGHVAPAPLADGPADVDIRRAAHCALQAGGAPSERAASARKTRFPRRAGRALGSCGTCGEWQQLSSLGLHLCAHERTSADAVVPVMSHRASFGTQKQQVCTKPRVDHAKTTISPGLPFCASSSTSWSSRTRAVKADRDADAVPW